MTRFFADPADIYDGAVRLSEDDLAHIRVLRLRPDEDFCVCDGHGTDYLCRLAEGGCAKITASRPSRGEPSVRCTVFAALSKGDRLETVVQKSVELGAHEIVLFPSERCVSLPDKRALSKKLERLGRISLEAAKQSGRGIVPAVTSAGSFTNAIELARIIKLSLFCYELENSQSIKQALTSAGTVTTAAVITGPEGGFTPEEAAYAVSQGIASVSLGPRILRCETAPLLALSAVMLYTDNV